MTREESANLAREIIARGKLPKPEMKPIRFTVPGNPIPWARTLRAGKRGHVFSDPRMVRAKRVVALAATLAMGKAAPTAERVEVRLRFFRATRQRCDLDRLASLPLDAMNGIVYGDDLQVVYLCASKAVDKANPRTEIEITEAV